MVGTGTKSLSLVLVLSLLARLLSVETLSFAAETIESAQELTQELNDEPSNISEQLPEVQLRLHSQREQTELEQRFRKESAEFYNRQASALQRAVELRNELSEVLKTKMSDWASAPEIRYRVAMPAYSVTSEPMCLVSVCS
jgi:hypothetical protein